MTIMATVVLSSICAGTILFGLGLCRTAADADERAAHHIIELRKAAQERAAHTNDMAA
jgi:hypothetical protein